MSIYQSFVDLHTQSKAFILGNVWNVASAKLMEAAGAKAIGSSSSAIADTLGYPDGEHISFDELFFIIERIAKHVHIPFSVDLEGGYSRDANEIATHIERLADVGVVGINLEDSVMDKTRVLLDAEVFGQLLTEIQSHLKRKNIDIFINARIDPYIIKHEKALEETLKRISIYESGGADGVFIPLIHQVEDISNVCQRTSLPINVLMKPNLPGFEALSELGVKRISLGNGWYDSGIAYLKQNASSLLAGNLKRIFEL